MNVHSFFSRPSGSCQPRIAARVGSSSAVRAAGSIIRAMSAPARRSGLAWSVLAAALAVTAVACGGADSRRRPGGPRDRLIFAAAADATTLDPHNTTDTESDQVIMMVYEPLIAFDDAMTIRPAAGRALERRRRRRDVDVPPARRRPLPRRHALRRRGRAPQFRPGPRPGGQPQAAVAVQHDRPRRGRRSADRAVRHQVPVRRLRADDRPRLVGDRQPGGGGRARQGVRDDRRRRSRAPGRTGSPAGRRTRRWCSSASTATGAIRE